MQVETKHLTKKTIAPQSIQQNENANTATKHTKESSGIATLSATIASSIEMSEIVMVSNTALQQQDHAKAKGDGEFVLKSQRIENFRKASAFWKDTL